MCLLISYPLINSFNNYFLMHSFYILKMHLVKREYSHKDFQNTYLQYLQRNIQIVRLIKDNKNVALFKLNNHNFL